MSIKLSLTNLLITSKSSNKQCKASGYCFCRSAQSF